MSNFDAVTGFIMNTPPPTQPNEFRMQIQNDDAANGPPLTSSDALLFLTLSALQRKTTMAEQSLQASTSKEM